MSTADSIPGRSRKRLVVILGAGLLIAFSGLVALAYVVDWVEDITWHR